MVYISLSRAHHIIRLLAILIKFKFLYIVWCLAFICIIVVVFCLKSDMAFFKLSHRWTGQVMAELTLPLLVAHLRHYCLSWALSGICVKATCGLVVGILLDTWTMCLLRAIGLLFHVTLVRHQIRDRPINFLDHSKIRYGLLLALTLAIGTSISTIQLLALLIHRRHRYLHHQLLLLLLC